MNIDTEFIDKLVSQAEEANREGDFKYAISCYQLAVNSYRKVCDPPKTEEKSFQQMIQPNIFDLDEELNISIPPLALETGQATHSDWIEHNRQEGKIIILKPGVARGLGRHLKTVLREAKRPQPERIGREVMIKKEDAKLWEIALKRAEFSNATADPEKITIKLGF